MAPVNIAAVIHSCVGADILHDYGKMNRGRQALLFLLAEYNIQNPALLFLPRLEFVLYLESVFREEFKIRRRIRLGLGSFALGQCGNKPRSDKTVVHSYIKITGFHVYNK